MRIALVTETFPPEVNGVSMTLGRLCNELKNRFWGIQVVRPVQRDEEVDMPRELSPFEEMIIPGIPLLGYDELRMGEMAVGLLYFSWKRQRPDIVHVATEGPLGLAALIAAKLSGLPVSSTFHTNFDQYTGHYQVGFFGRAMAAYLRWFHNQCECTLAPTRQMADILSIMGYQRTGVFSRGVDTELFDPAKRDEELRRNWRVGKKGKVILYVGRVAKEKNIDLALQAFEACRAKHPDDRMVVVGSGPELEFLCRKYPDTHYAGVQRSEDLARHYASADIFLFPSVTETFGNVVTEAMASGLAVVTYDYAAGREHIRSGENGQLAAFNEPEAFKEAFGRLRSMDDDSLAVLRERARATAKKISWEAVVSEFELQIRQQLQLMNCNPAGEGLCPERL